MKSWTRFFHLYWIPLIPYKSGKFVECARCHGTWAEAVLDYDPEADRAEFRAAFEDGMLQAMIALAEADGRVAEAEVLAIADVMSRLTGREYSVGDVHSSIARSGGRTVTQALHGIADSLNDQGKKMVIVGLLMVAHAEGGVRDRERSLVLEAARVLAVDSQHVDQLFNRFSS